MPRPSGISSNRRWAATVTLEIPTNDDDDGNAIFDRLARTLTREWSARLVAAHPALGPAPIPWLTRAAYLVLQAILDSDLGELFEFRIKRSHRYARGRPAGLNPFQIGLMALFAHDPTAIRRQVRERVGKELWYAYRHYVPPEFLLGFLSQVRSTDLGRRAADGESEPDFKDWIIACRVEGQRSDKVRGEYPPDIEEEVERIRDERADAEGIGHDHEGVDDAAEEEWD